jgi:hypothetical protein
MHSFNLYRSLLLAAVTLLVISHSVNAQQNFNLNKVQFSSSASLPTHTTVPTPVTVPSSAPPVILVPVPAPVTNPTSPLLASVPTPSPQATTQATGTGTCATPLECLQCRDNVRTFLSAMQVRTH